ncbi:MAG: carboxypeptidase-like regulatory domain-containing protein [Desulfomonilaceae bacterium]|nr:carboxypeptidase-like regulatory domain-containing protein [Desulfomonilaceae bacterium]
MIDKVYLALSEPCGHRGCLTPWMVCLPLLVLMVPAADLWAGPPMPGEEPTGLFHTITHLHPAAYVLLFLVFVLSVINLVFQFGVSNFMRPVASLFSFVRRDFEVAGTLPVLRGLKRSRIGSSVQKCDPQAGSTRVDSDGAAISMGIPVKPVRQTSAPVVPTPLEGVNHALPKFTEPWSHQSGTPRVRGPQPDQRASEFRFSSAVDVPTPEEVERRERTQLVVTGSVLGPDGKGIPSVIVYLTDDEGNRVGQSCRTMPETGEFKVLTGEPGTYRISGYKRGFVLEGSEAPRIPIESGRIEGFNFRMIPEGCGISGRVVRDESGEGLPKHDVTCVCAVLNYTRSVQTAADGQFRMNGIPVNSECFLEVRGEDGGLLAATDTFQTVQKKEMYIEIKIANPEPESREEPDAFPGTDPAGTDATEDESVLASGRDDSTDRTQDPESLPPRGSGAPTPA